ncbi:hypothetical protein [Stenotrophomonas sp. S4]
MNSASIIYEALVNEFPGALQSLTDVSRNTSDARDFVKSPVAVFNFDNIKNVKTTSSGTEQSPDALFCLENTLYFVEFKEGACNKADVRQKIHEGVLTVYQYAMSRELISRDDFFSMSIKYALIKRMREGKGGNSFLATLEMSVDHYSLKNMEGFVVSDTAVRYIPQSIFTLLHRISGGSIAAIDYINSDSSVISIS